MTRVPGVDRAIRDIVHFGKEMKMRTKLVKLNALSSVLSLLTILIFFTGSIASGLFGDKPFVTNVKIAIFYGIWFLLPAIATAGITGNRLGNSVRELKRENNKKHLGYLITNKQKRMAFIAANGLLVLIPASVFLKTAAVAGHLDTIIYIVQSIELVAGFTNIALMTLDINDGLSLSKISNQKNRVISK